MIKLLIYYSRQYGQLRHRGIDKNVYLETTTDETYERIFPNY